MKIEVLYFKGCPNYLPAVDRLRTVLAREGGEPVLPADWSSPTARAALDRALDSRPPQIR
jgi:hypothetical protein